MLKILGLPTGRDGCSFYRLRQPLQKIARLGLADVQFVSATDDTDTMVNLVKQADVIFLRNGQLKFFNLVKNNPQEYGHKIWILDEDDDLKNVSPYSDAYRFCGLEEVMHEDQHLWEDGQNNFDIERNRQAHQEHEQVLNSVNAITVTTDILRQTMLGYNHKVKVLPNCIDFSVWPLLNLKPKKEIRIGWAGGSSHYEDLYSIKDQLKKVLEKYPNTVFYFIGQPFPGIVKEFPKGQVKTIGWIDPEGHSYRQATLDLDIALMPLTDTPFNRNKSEIKWLEATATKTASLAKNIPPYSPVIKDGENGLLYDTPEGFYHKLCQLVEDKNLREQLGENAYAWAYDNRNMDKWAKEYVNYFNDLSHA